MTTPGTESLLIGGVIEILNGGYTVTNLATCPGAQFGLGGSTGAASGGDWSLGAPQPVVDLLATLLGDGSVPMGRRADNRTIVLPIIIRAPDLMTLAAARESLFALVDQPAWELIWTRPGGPPFTLDCFRASPTTITYSLEDADALVSRIVLTFQALPYGRSSTAQVLQFTSPTTDSTAPPASVNIDTFATVSTTTQGAMWSRSAGQNVSGAGSAHWSYAASGGDTGPLYTHTLGGSPVNITNMTALTFWLGLASPQNYRKWHKGRVHFSVVLIDTNGRRLTIGGWENVAASNAINAPTWNPISLTIPTTSATFNYSQVASYTWQMWRFQDTDRDLEYDGDLYLNALTAQPSTVVTAPLARGAVYQLLGVVGSAHAPVNLTCQQPPSPQSVSVTYNTPGPVSFVPPAGVTSLQVQKWGSGGRGGPRTTAGQGGGGKGGEFTQNNSFPCTPGVAVNGFVGAGAPAAGGGFLGRVLTIANASKTATSFSATVPVTTTGGMTLLAYIVVDGGNTVTGVTDTQGNTWVQDYSAPNPAAGSGITIHMEVWRCQNAISLTKADRFTFTLNNPNSTNGGSCIVDQFVPLGAPSATGSGGTSGTSGTASVTSVAGDLVAVAAVCLRQGTPPNETLGNVTGMTSSGSKVNNNIDLMHAAYLNAPSAAAHSATWSWGNGHSWEVIVLSYPSAAGAGYLNGQDTWFGAQDSTAAHGGLGVAANTATGATAMTGTSTEPIHFAGGNGATGTSSGGGGGGSSAGTGAGGNNGAVPGGGAAPTGGAAGGNGGASGGNNPGASGAAPGAGGGGAFATSATPVAAGGGGNGQIVLTYTQQFAPMQTMLIHMPGPNAPATFVPLVPVGGGSDPPDGRAYPVPQYAPGVGADFGGTYTCVLTALSFDTPSSSRTVTVTITQTEYGAGPSYSVAVARSFVPANDIVNGVIVIDNVTLPIRQVPPDNTTVAYTVSVTCSNGNDVYMDCLFLDTEGQIVFVNVGDIASYTSYWIDEPEATADLGLVSASAIDRTSAVSVLNYAIISGGPLSIDPVVSNQWILAYAVEGQPALGLSYLPRYWVDDPAAGPVG